MRFLMMFKTTEYSSAFFDSKKSNAELKKEYDQKLAAFQSLVAKVAPENNTGPNTAPLTSGLYRVNPVTSQWESVEERNDREFKASKALLKLFNEQQALVDDENQFSKFNEGLTSKVSDILVEHQLQSPNPTLETANQELLRALRQLSQKLKMPNNISRKNSLVAIEVMDLVTRVLNAHLGTNKADNSKPFSKNDIILKLAGLGKLLEHDGINGTFFIVLGTLLAVAGLTLLGGLIACTAVPSFGLTVCTMVGVTLSTNTVGAVLAAGHVGLFLGVFTSIGGFLITDITSSHDANPEAAKAILDVSKAWDLEPIHCASPSITG